MKRTLLAATAAVALAAGPAALAKAPAASTPASATPAPPGTSESKPDPAKLARAKAAFEASLTRTTGTVQLPAAKATLNLGDRFYYLSPADARKVLVDAWGNPPEATRDVLGMIFPAGVSPLDDGNWGAVLTYEASGYVPDKDARKLKYDDMLEKMREGEADRNEQRQKEGFPTVHLVGWAQPPVYDPAHHSLIWARELQFSGARENMVNYDVRALGREGVLSMNIVAGASVLPRLKSAGEALQSVASFTPGATYADYRNGDHKAAYGLGGLILAGAGIVAVKKIGLLAVALLFLKKGAVVLLAMFGGVGAWIRRKLGMKPKAAKASTPVAAPLDEGREGNPPIVS